MKTLRKIMSFAIVICFIFNTASPAFALSDLDMLRSMIRQIEYTDIMDDEAVLAIGNDIERANEIYNSLHSVDKELLTTAKSSMLEAYVKRIAEILSMRTISASPRAATGNTFIKDGIAYYEHNNFYTRCGPPGSANIFLDGKMYIRTSNTTDTCKSTSCVLPEHENMHNKSITNNQGALVWSGKSTVLFGLQWHSGTPIGQLQFKFTDMVSDDGDVYATSVVTFHYGSESKRFGIGSGGGIVTSEYIANLEIVLDPHSDRKVKGDINVFLANGGWIEAELWSRYYPYTAKVIIAKDESIFDNTPPTVPTVTAKPVGRFYINPIDMNDDTKNAVEFLGYSTYEEIEEDKKDRVERKVLSDYTSQNDVLYKLIRNIGRTDIMDDEAVLFIGNEIERAYEIYNSLSVEQQELLPSVETSLLMAYVDRMTEILSMRSINTMAISDLPDTITKDGILYYKMPTTFMYRKKDSYADTWTRNIPLNIVAYSRFNGTGVCSSLTCNDTAHGHNRVTTHSEGMLPNNNNSPASFSCYIGYTESNAVPIMKTGIWDSDNQGPQDTWTFYSNGSYLLNGTTYPLSVGTTIGTHKFSHTGSSGWGGVALLGDLQELFNMGGLMKVSSTFNTNYFGNRGTTRVIFGTESAFDTIAPTVPTIETKKVTKLSIASEEDVEEYGVASVTRVDVDIDEYMAETSRKKKSILSSYIDVTTEIYSLIDKIQLVDIKNDEAVLSIGNDIERANELYNSLPVEHRESLAKVNILKAYVDRMTEILSMRSIGTMAIADLPDTITKDGILYYKDNSPFTYTYRTASVWKSLPLNGVVAYTRFNRVGECQSLSCNDTSHNHNKKLTTSNGLTPRPLLQFYANTEVAGNDSWFFSPYENNDDENGHYYHTATANYLLNGTNHSITPGLTLGSNVFYDKSYPGAVGVGLRGNVQDFFDMGGLLTLSANWDSSPWEYCGNMYALFGVESAFDLTPPTVPTISLMEKVKQVLSATLDWFNGDVEITIGGSTDSGGSGLKGYEYQIDGGTWQTYTAPFTVNATCTVNARAVDNANNRSANATKEIRIDKVAPSAPVITKLPNTTFANSDVTVTIAHGMDSQSGVAKTEYQIDSGAWQNYTAPIVISSTSTVKARTIDNVGLISTVSSSDVKIDKIAPSAPAIIKSPAGEFSNSNVTITINGSTDTGGSLLKGYEYQLNGGAWQSYTVPLTITSTTSITARAVDNALNYSTVSNAEVKIDKVAPTVPSIIKSPVSEWANDDVTVVITSGTDDYSGVAKTEYQLNSGAWQTYTAPLVISSNTTIKARTIDNANNISSEVSEEIKIDRVAPSVPVIIKSPAGEFANDDVTITINGSADTGGSGLNNYEYQLNGGTWQSYTAPLTITSTTTINARAVDNALNYSSISSEEVKVDRIAPTAPTITKSPTREFANDDVIVVITSGTDDYSGVASTEYQLDGSSWLEYTVPLVISSNTTIKARTIDNANNISMEVSEEVKIDRVAPSVPVIIKSPAEEFANDDVTITINGSTDTGGSGLKNYEYQLDGGAWQTYTSPLTITSTTSINARAVDNALNYSSILTEEVKIDRTPPIVRVEKTPDDWTNGDVTIFIQVEDSESGLKSFGMTSPSAIAVDMGTDFITTTSASFVVDKNAIYSFIIENLAGLQVKFNSTVDKIEDLPPTPPKVDESGEGTPPLDPTVPDHIEKDWANAPIELPVTSDAPSGIKKFQYIIEENNPNPLRRARSALRQAWIDYEGTVFKVEKEGVYTLRVRSVSNAGNISDVSTYLIRNDYTAPTATHEFKENKAVITADDTLSGVGKITCSHGDVTTNTAQCEIQAGTSHDYKVYDTAGNVLGYSIEKAVIAPPPSSGDNGDDYEYPPSSSVPTIEEPKKDIDVNPVPSKPIENIVTDSNSKTEEIITNTDNSNKIEPIKPPPENKKDVDTSNNTSIARWSFHINWWILFFLILMIIAIIVLIREISNNKGEDKNDVR